MKDKQFKRSRLKGANSSGRASGVIHNMTSGTIGTIGGTEDVDSCSFDWGIAKLRKDFFKQLSDEGRSDIPVVSSAVNCGFNGKGA